MQQKYFRLELFLPVAIKTKQKMFKTHFLSHDQVKVNFFKKYSNKLSKIKELVKQTYFSTQFYLNKEDMIINRKKKSNIIIPKLLHNNRCYTDKQSICEQLNTYFINVGPTSAQLPIHRNSDPSKYIRRTFSNGFFFSPIHKYEVRDNCNFERKQINYRFPYQMRQICL